MNKYNSRPPKHCTCDRCWPCCDKHKFSKKKYWHCKDKQWNRYMKWMKRI